jgi:hypothetical protein
MKEKKKKIIVVIKFKTETDRGAEKSQRHPEFPSGLPSKYYLGPMLLNFSDRTRTGVFNMVWPFAMKGLPIEYC